MAIADAGPTSPQPGPSAPQPGDPSAVRLDVWLWSVRLAKTRSAATADCRGGHVRLNGQPVKAAQPVHPGDEVRLRRPGIEHVYRVRRLLARRVGAPVARGAYEDLTPPPPPDRGGRWTACAGGIDPSRAGLTRRAGGHVSGRRRGAPAGWP